MGRVTKPISDAEVRKAKPADKMYKLFDGNGRKVWRVEFRWHGKTRSYTIGDYPVVTLWSARATAQEVRQNAKDGVDPVRGRNDVVPEEEETVRRFRDVAREFLAFKAQEYSLTHYNKQLRRLEIYIYPSIGDRNIKEITKQDLIALLKNIPNVETCAGA